MQVNVEIKAGKYRNKLELSFLEKFIQETTVT